MYRNSEIPAIPVYSFIILYGFKQEFRMEKSVLGIGTRIFGGISIGILDPEIPFSGILEFYGGRGLGALRSFCENRVGTARRSVALDASGRNVGNFRNFTRPGCCFAIGKRDCRNFLEFRNFDAS